jgi:DHA3 family macrolide efflux protein-like MFS transporter
MAIIIFIYNFFNTRFYAATDEKKENLFNKNFFILWHSQWISQLGSQAFSIAMLLWIKHITGSATLMGSILMVSLIPGVLLGPFGGVFADSYSRKKIMVCCDLICGLSVLLFTSLFFFCPDHPQIMLTAIFFASLCIATSKAFFNPAVLAAIPDTVPDTKIPQANALSQISMQLAVFIGVSTGGVLFRVLGAPVLFLADGLSYLYSGLAKSFMKLPKGIQERRHPLKDSFTELKANTREGFTYMWKNKGMRKTFILAGLLNFFFAPALVSLPFYVEDVLRVKSDWYGYLMAGFGGGAMLGYIMAGLIKKLARLRMYLISVFFVLLGFLNFILGINNNILAALAIIFFSGMATGYINICIINQLQINTQANMRGRVFGNLNTLTGGIMPVSLGLAGFIIDAIDKQVDILFKVTGLIMLMVSIAISFNKELLIFLGKEPEKNYWK